MVSNAWLLWRHKGEVKAAPLRYNMILPACAFTILGVWFLEVMNDGIIILLLAIVVGIFLALLLFNPSFKLDGKIGRVCTPIASMVGGFVQGAAGSFWAFILHPASFVSFIKRGLCFLQWIVFVYST